MPTIRDASWEACQLPVGRQGPGKAELAQAQSWLPPMVSTAKGNRSPGRLRRALSSRGRCRAASAPGPRLCSRRYWGGLTPTRHSLASACDGLKGYYITDSCSTRTQDGSAAHAALRSGWRLLSAQLEPKTLPRRGMGVFSNLKSADFRALPQLLIQFVCVVPMN